MGPETPGEHPRIPQQQPRLPGDSGPAQAWQGEQGCGSSVVLPFSLPACVPNHLNPAGPGIWPGSEPGSAAFLAPGVEWCASPHGDPHRAQGASQPIPISTTAVGEDGEGPCLLPGLHAKGDV